jgi:CheY-like chemotaxis protein
MMKDLKILVVDDDPGILEVLEGYLEGQGCAATTSRSGQEALETLRRNPVDLVLSDIEMAGINGFELLKEARERYPQIAIVLMTGYEERYSMSEALAAGADGYLSKPFNLSKLSLLFEQAYWKALSRLDWWEERNKGGEEEAQARSVVRE